MRRWERARTRRLANRLGLLMLGSWLLASPAWALFGIGDTAIVSDPWNLIENSATAVNTLDTVRQVQQQVQDQLTFIAQEAKHLVALPNTLITPIQDVMSTYNSILATVQGVGYQVNGLEQQWNMLFGGLRTGSLTENVQAIAGALKQVAWDAAQAEAIYTQLCQQTAQIQRLLTASQAAPGTLAATQATNQLLGTLAGQQQMLAQMQATGDRVQVMWIMQDTQANQQAQQNVQQWMQGYDEIKPAGFGQGQGPALPE
jgi:type IV secretion system protein TrbJ